MRPEAKAEATMKNERYANGSLRRKHRARFKAMDAPCGICKGKYGPIHYDEPSDHNHPLSFVIDEIIPISRALEFGYSSKREAAEDWNNLQAAHYWCNAQKSNKLPNEQRKRFTPTKIVQDGTW
jgi:5-methylcytosine-specific restriction endonuclease McrA